MDEDEPQRLPPYITPAGYRKLTEEIEQLARVERPRVVNEVSDAAAQGDRSENAEYIYGKKRLREIDRRLGFLAARVDAVKVVDPTEHPEGTNTVYFGATVTLEDENGKRFTYTLVGEDETDSNAGRISIQSPMGRALLKKKVGESALVRRPAGEMEVTVLKVSYRG